MFCKNINKYESITKMFKNKKTTRYQMCGLSIRLKDIFGGNKGNDLYQYVNELINRHTYKRTDNAYRYVFSIL